jgi:hypothetical protein
MIECGILQKHYPGRTVMMRKKRQKEKSGNQISNKPYYISFEMQMCSELLHYWATDKEFNNKVDKYAKATKLLRSSISKCNKLHKTQIVPRDFIYDEKKLAYEAIKYVNENYSTIDDLSKCNIHYKLKKKGGSIIDVRKPFPNIPESAKQVLQHQESFVHTDQILKPRSIDAVAGRLVACRFNISEESVRKLKEPPELPDETKVELRLLATCFLELSSTDDWPTKARILDTLYSAGYSIYKLYWLTRLSHRFTYCICCGTWEPDMIDRLCKFVCFKPNKTPFTNMLESLDFMRYGKNEIL